MRTIYLLLTLLFFSFQLSFAIVKYDQGRRQIRGIELLQDYDDPNAYYYLPQYPKLSEKEDGSLEILCMKYTGKNGTNGGIFHALVEFSLPDDEIEALTEELKKETNNNSVYIAGMVPMLQHAEDGNNPSRFKVISATLNPDNGSIKNNLITSGFAPLREGSKAAFAVNLNATQATLLWDSFDGPTSDVSISISGYYEAVVKAYNAVIDVDVSTLYEHSSKHFNYADGYNRQSIKKFTDELISDRNIDIDIFDRSKTLGADVTTEEGIVDLITDKLIELMFDSETGWAKVPIYEDDNSQYIPNRQKRGFFSKVFGGARNEKYVSDNQFIFKKREDIVTNKFYLNLSKSTTIKVPVYASGNLGGDFFTALKDDPKYFREDINLDDPAFKWRDIYFNLDVDVLGSFDEYLNSISIDVRKLKEDGTGIFPDPINFNRKNIRDTIIQKVQYPRLGVEDESWKTYEYRLIWGIRDDYGEPIKSNWIKTDESQINLNFPGKKNEIFLLSDFGDVEDMQAAVVNFLATYNGKTYKKVVKIDAKESQPQRNVSFFSDEGTPILYQIIWLGKRYTDQKNKKIASPERLEDNVLYIVAPE